MTENILNAPQAQDGIPIRWESWHGYIKAPDGSLRWAGFFHSAEAAAGWLAQLPEDRMVEFAVKRDVPARETVIVPWPKKKQKKMKKSKTDETETDKTAEPEPANA